MNSMKTAQVSTYLASEMYNELNERQRDDVDEVTKRLYIHAKEFYWTVTRLVGLGHLHDGSRSRRYAAVERITLPEDAVLLPLQCPRLLIDVTPTQRLGYKTGIQRVVQEIAKNAILSGAGLPVFIANGRLVSFFRHASLPDEVEVVAGDKFLMLDSSWPIAEETTAIMKAVTERGGENIVGLYDLIPLNYPTVFAPETVSTFKHWFETIVLASDGVVCISRSTADSLVNYVRRSGYSPKFGQRIGWWPLGADFSAAPASPPSPVAAAIVATESPFFLSVGTIEPRKGYSVALSAFDHLWLTGADIRYVIVGGSGWQSRALESRIRLHPEFGRRLFWLENASDADLHLLYAHAHSLIAASFAEGFGLPLVEAAYHRLPVIASDIPVFREITDSKARFFDLLDEKGLAKTIQTALADKRTSTQAHIWTWKESTHLLTELVHGNAYQMRLPDESSGHELHWAEETAA
jgi:alpha-1,2-rhamnosyltransferase